MSNLKPLFSPRRFLCSCLCFYLWSGLVFTAAQHGAGVYDFLVFTERVPKNAIVVVALSKLVQLRRLKKDRNRSGLSFWALKVLYSNNYSIEELKKKSMIKTKIQLVCDVSPKNRTVS